MPKGSYPRLPPHMCLQAAALMGSSSTGAAAAAGMDFKFCPLALPAFAYYRVIYYFTSWLLTLPGLSYESGGAPYKLVVWAPLLRRRPGPALPALVQNLRRPPRLCCSSSSAISWPWCALWPPQRLQTEAGRRRSALLVPCAFLYASTWRSSFCATGSHRA